MQILHDCIIAAPLDKVWPVLIDPRQAVSAVPGATLTSQDGDNFTGQISVKLGPMNFHYDGEGTLEADTELRQILLRGRGIEKRGGGTANAAITAKLTPTDAATAVAITVDVDLTGKPAQFGRGILSEVVASLAKIFVQRLEQHLASTDTDSASTAPPHVEPIDLLSISSAGVLIKKYAPLLVITAAAATVASLLISYVRRRRGLRELPTS